MTIKQIQDKIGSIHTDELRWPCFPFAFAHDGKLGRGNSALEAIEDAECEVADNGVWQYVNKDLPFVSQCWSDEGDECGLLFKF
jgi:hypothetical protein